MKLSLFVLFVMILSIVVYFTKLNLWANIKLIYIIGMLFLFCLLTFIEIHRENKKRHQLVNEIRGNY